MAALPQDTSTPQRGKISAPDVPRGLLGLQIPTSSQHPAPSNTATSHATSQQSISPPTSTHPAAATQPSAQTPAQPIQNTGNISLGQTLSSGVSPSVTSQSASANPVSAQHDQLSTSGHVQFLVAPDSIVEQMRASATTKSKLDDIVPGFKSSAQDLAVPSRVDEAIKNGKYVPYTALSASQRIKSSQGDEDYAFVASGGIKVKGLDRTGEHTISLSDWLVAAKAVLKRVRHFHGDARADALENHHDIVTSLAASHGWEIAVKYDINCRETAAANPRHDLTGLDKDALFLITSKAILSSAKRPSTDDSPFVGNKRSRSFATDHGSNTTSSSSSNPCCFRCGAFGHLPADCSAQKTSAGRRPFPVSANQYSRNLLSTFEGKPICFTFARTSACRFTQKCISQPFDACVWAMATCAFFGMMRFGEVSARSQAKFDKSNHLTRKDAILGYDMNGSRYVRLDLAGGKTAKPGEIQFIYLTNQGSLCPIEALKNLAAIVPARTDDPLFSWRDQHGSIRPMVHSTAFRRVNDIILEGGFGTSFGHSFRIGGASFYLAKGVSPEIVRIAGRWKSLAYELYIRAFEQVATLHLSDRLPDGVGVAAVPAAVV